MKKIFTLFLSMLMVSCCFMTNVYADAGKFQLFYCPEYGTVSSGDSTNFESETNFDTSEVLTFTLTPNTSTDIPICIVEDGTGESINVYTSFECVSGNDVPETRRNSYEYPKIEKNQNDNSYTLTYKAETSNVAINVNWSMGELQFNDFYLDQTNFPGYYYYLKVTTNDYDSGNDQGHIEIDGFDDDRDPRYDFKGNSKFLLKENVNTIVFVPHQGYGMCGVVVDDVFYSEDGQQGGPEANKATFTSNNKFNKNNNGYWTYQTNADDFTDNNLFMRVEFCPSGESGGNEEDTSNCDIVINNIGYVRNVIKDADNNDVEIYIPKNTFLNTNDLLQYVGDSKRVLIYAKEFHQKLQDHIDYYEGYYYRPTCYAEFYMYDLTGVDLANIDFSTLTAIEIPNNVTIPVCISINESGSESDIDSFINNYSNRYRVYNKTNNVISNVAKYYENIETDSYKIVKNYNENISRYFACVEVSFKKCGVYYVAEPVFDEVQESNINTPQGVVNGIVGEDSLMYYLEEMLYTRGNEIKLQNNTYSVSEDLIFRNYGHSTGSFEIENYDTDIKIDLNGSTINLIEGHALDIEANSVVHICNGTICSNGISTINNYGGLCLENVKVVNTNENGSAIKSCGYGLTIDQYCDIQANNNGIIITNSNSNFNYTSPRCVLMGKVSATKKGVFIDNLDNESITFNMCARDRLITNGTGKDPTIIAGEYGIYANGKANISISGYDDWESQQLRLASTITAPTAIAVNGGRLEINCPSTVTSNGTNAPLVEVLANNTNKSITQEILMSVSICNVSTSTGSIVKVSGDDNMLNKLSITYQSAYNYSKFTYGGNAFEFNNCTPTVRITGGVYSGNDFASYLTGTGYIINQTGTNEYSVVPNENIIQVDYTFNANDEVNSIAELRSYLENYATAQINVKNDITPKNHYEFNVTSPKNIMLKNFTPGESYGETYEFNNVTFNVDLPDSSDIFCIWCGSLENNTTIIDLTYGMAGISDSTVKVTGADPAVIQRGGTLAMDRSNSKIIAASEGIRIDAPDGAQTSVCGSITAPLAINVVNSVYYNDKGISIEKTENCTTTPQINGEIVVKDARLIMREADVDVTSLDNKSAITLKGDAELIIEADDVDVKGSEAAVKIYDDAIAGFTGGSFSGYDVIKVMGNSDENSAIVETNPTVRITGRAYFETSDEVNGSILKIADSVVCNDMFEVYSGFYNVPVVKAQFPNLYELRSYGNYDEGMYKCLQYAAVSSQYPYVVLYMYTNSNSAVVNEGRGKQISAYLDQLEDANLDAEENEYTIMVANELEEVPDSFDEYDVDECYDISINDIKDGNVEKIEECDTYQFIELEVDEGNAEKTVIYHKHGNEDPRKLTKISKDDGLAMLIDNSKCAECYYVKDSKTIVVVTRRFSLFATALSNTEVETEQIEIIDNIAIIDSMNVILSEKIGLNIYVKIKESEIVFDEVELHYTIDNKNERSVLVSEGTKVSSSPDEEGYSTYVNSIELDAKHMNSNVNVWIVADDRDGSVTNASLNQYCQALIDSEESSAELKNFANSIKTFGDYSAYYFNNVSGKALLTNDHVDALNTYKYAISSIGSSNTIKLTKASLVLASTTSIRIYYNINSSYNKDSFTFSVKEGDQTIDSSRLNITNSYIEIKNIKPSELMNKYNLTIVLSGSETPIISMTYSPLSYAEQVNNLSGDKYINLKNLMISMYDYALSANAYATYSN